jgi:hypothetical protein
VVSKAALPDGEIEVLRSTAPLPLAAFLMLF